MLVTAAALVIMVATLTPVPGAASTGSPLCIACGQRGVADFLSNVMLFAPLGIGLVLLGVSLRRTALIGVLFSAGVEAAQLGIIAGRDANIGDVVSNGAGAAVGWWLGHTRDWWLRPDPGSLRRFAGVGAATLVLLLGGLLLFTPALPDTTYYLQWTARFGGMQPYEGRVLASRFGALELAGPPWKIEQRDSVRTALHSGVIDVMLVTGPPPTGLAPIVSIYDTYGREIMLLGADGNDFVYRYRTRADALRFDRADLVLEDVLRGPPIGSTAPLRLEQDRGGACLTIDDVRRCGRGFTIGETWSLLMFPDGWSNAVRGVMSLAWLFGAFLPTGFLARRRRLALAAIILVGGILFVVPPLIGFAATPVLQIAAAGAGLGAGHGLEAMIRRMRGSRTRASAAM